MVWQINLTGILRAKNSPYILSELTKPNESLKYVLLCQGDDRWEESAEHSEEGDGGDEQKEGPGD